MKTFITLLLAFFMLGCSNKTQVIYKEVKIPIKCNVDKIPKPAYSDNLIQDLKNLAVYAELLEKDLNFCIGENHD